MIDAIEARKLMPSAQQAKKDLEKKLKEISDMIEDAARQDRNSITLHLYQYEKEATFDALKERGFLIQEIPFSFEYIIDTDIYRCKYKISW